MSEFLLEFRLYLKDRKKFWLLPILITLMALSAIIFLAHGTALAPFVYTLF